MHFRASLLAFTVPMLLLAPPTARAQVDPGDTPPRILSTDRAELRLMPLPMAAELGAGSLDLRRGLTTVGVRCADYRVARALVRFGRQLTQMRPRTPSARGGRVAFSVSCAKRGGSIQQPVEDESYTVTVLPNELALSAQTPFGVLRGLETILQLVQRTDSTISVPVITIEDRPRYPWRGLMIDTARHFIPVSYVLRTVDAMAFSKYNTLHWHLVDAESFPFEVCASTSTAR